MTSASKLTKKQKKALAYRERKGKGKTKSFDELDNDVPIEEDQDLVEAGLDEEAAPVETQAGPGAGAKKRGSEDEDVLVAGHQTKKRKREVEDTSGEDQDVRVEAGDTQKLKTKKKRKGADGAGIEVEGEEGAGNAVDKKGKQRFILFVGNLKFTTPKEAVEKHFAKCDPPPTVRLMTPKPSASSKPTIKSKGFAFVEFTHRNALQQGLKLHQSELDGRKINVELTAGGGGKSEARLEKVKQRNRELHEQRKKQLDKRSSIKKKTGGAEEEFEDVQIERPQRYSATSGVDQGPLKKRTWSVPEVDDEGGASGKKRGRKGKKRPPKPLGTGVNAIPVG